MSNDQPPRDDEQDVKPTVAEYTRADASKLPQTPAGQLAAVEGVAAAAGLLPADNPKLAAHNRKMLHRKFGTVDESTPGGRFQALMLAAMEEHERQTAAARAAQGDTNPYDLPPYAEVHDLAQFYDEARTDTEHPNALDRFLDNLADDLDLADVRALRTAAAAAADAMGRIALAAREQGKSPDTIAAKTGYTASRIAQFIRQERERLADAQWDALVSVEQHDGDAWRGVSVESVATTERPSDLARRVLGRARESEAAGTLRVRVWRFGDSDGPHLAEAIHTHDDRMPDDQ
ncbi:hypothetical protein AB0I84_04755 [Streptomyces spectabilis]|uniref:hypothetical protein n=1 Tax=Streptomyces spectabilis TaxID=68270 RepID=UPI0033C805C9